MAVEELIRQSEQLKDDASAIDQVIDGFTDTKELADVDEDDAAVQTDIGAAAMTSEQLEEMRDRALKLFAGCAKEIEKIRASFGQGSPVRQGPCQDCRRARSGALCR